MCTQGICVVPTPNDIPLLMWLCQWSALLSLQFGFSTSFNAFWCLQHTRFLLLYLSDWALGSCSCWLNFSCFKEMEKIVGIFVCVYWEWMRDACTRKCAYPLNPLLTTFSILCAFMYVCRCVDEREAHSLWILVPDYGYDVFDIHPFNTHYII